MKRASDWTLDEFETLLQSPTLTDEDIHRKLSNRTVDAIQFVRHGIHAYHTGLDTSMLSQMMLRRLEAGAGSLICPVCEMRLG